MSLILKHNIGDSVVRLLSLCRPAAIFWAVWSVVIRPSIDCKTAPRDVPHIREKTLKPGNSVLSMEPSVADKDTAFFVMSECWAFVAHAPSDHVRPTGIDARYCSPSGVPMRPLIPAPITGFAASAPSHAEAYFTKWLVSRGAM